MFEPIERVDGRGEEGWEEEVVRDKVVGVLFTWQIWIVIWSGGGWGLGGWVGGGYGSLEGVLGVGGGWLGGWGWGRREGRERCGDGVGGRLFSERFFYCFRENYRNVGFCGSAGKKLLVTEKQISDFTRTDSYHALSSHGGGLQDVDVELGELREEKINPMHDEEEGGEKILSREGEGMKSPEKNIEKGDSVKNFEKRFKDQMEGVARKAVGAKGTEATEAVNQEALGRLMSGGVAGMDLENLNIGINWMQSLGVVLQFEVEWPER